jgi:t-SNARE complex subunit (syntaxin)
VKKIFTSCPQCSGTGIERISALSEGETVFEEITCRRCNGSGKVSNQSLSDDLIDLFNDISNKIDDIKEKVDEIKTAVDEL